jgi:putative flippase GtrA
MSGGISFIFEYCLFLVLVYLFSFAPWLGQFISYGLTIVVNFLLIRNWTFAEQKGNKLLFHMASYGFLVTFNLLATTTLIYLLTNLGVLALYAKMVIILLVVIWNFLIYDRVVFRNKA